MFLELKLYTENKKCHFFPINVKIQWNLYQNHNWFWGLVWLSVWKAYSKMYIKIQEAKIVGIILKKKRQEMWEGGAGRGGREKSRRT